ncbi:meiotic cell cortex C-terminal pleckstrin homology-domain-containing protein [Hyaloraphidium curvatum]|nr:meiotic cell cortex C-terminal pleckstrin homology-domain-containing protein [Hyaloraphidium curvatum]
MSVEDLYLSDSPPAAAVSTPTGRLKRITKLLPMSSPLTPDPPRRPRPPTAREATPKSNESSPSYSPSAAAAQDRLTHMDVTASMVQQLRQATRRNAALESSRTEAWEKARVLEEQIAAFMAKTERLTGENRKLGERMWELENENHTLEGKRRELEEHVLRKDAELRALAERSRRAIDMIEDTKAAETSHRREKDDLLHRNDMLQSSLRKLRNEWHAERSDLMRQLQELAQELEDYRRTGTPRFGLSSQPSALEVVPDPTPDPQSTAKEDEEAVTPETISPPSLLLHVDPASVPPLPNAEPVSFLDSLIAALGNVLSLLGEMDSQNLLGEAAVPPQWATILEMVDNLRRALEERFELAQAETKEVERLPDKVGSSLLTIFEHGASQQTFGDVLQTSMPELSPSTAVVEPTPTLEDLAKAADGFLSKGSAISFGDGMLEAAAVSVLPSLSLEDLDAAVVSGGEIEPCQVPSPETSEGAVWQTVVGARSETEASISEAAGSIMTQSEAHEEANPASEAMEDSLPPLRPRPATENTQRRRVSGRAGRPKSLFFSTLASISDAMRRFSMHESVAEEQDESDAASVRSASSFVDGTPLDLAEPSSDVALFALTQCMVGSRMQKFNKYGKRPQERYVWVNPFNGTLHWSPQDPTLDNTGSKVKTARILSVTEEIDSRNGGTPKRRSLRFIIIRTPSRHIRLSAVVPEDHGIWIQGLGELLKRRSGQDSRLTQLIFLSNATPGAQ